MGNTVFLVLPGVLLRRVRTSHDTNTTGAAGFPVHTLDCGIQSEAKSHFQTEHFRQGVPYTTFPSLGDVIG